MPSIGWSAPSSTLVEWRIGMCRDPAAVYGIDNGKNIFHVVGLSGDGRPVQKARFRRHSLRQVHSGSPGRYSTWSPVRTPQHPSRWRYQSTGSLASCTSTVPTATVRTADRDELFDPRSRRLARSLETSSVSSISWGAI